MAPEAKAEEIGSSRRRPRTSMKVELKGAGGILVLGGAIIAAAFAAHRARTARRRGAAAAAAAGSTSSNATPQVQQKGQEEAERSRALPDSGGVADGAQHGDGGLCDAALEVERKEQVSLKAGDDVQESNGFVFELEKADAVSHEDRTVQESDCCSVNTAQQIGEIKSEESEPPSDGSKFSDVEDRAEEDSSSESSLNEPCVQMQVISDGFMMVRELEQDSSATASNFSVPQCHPELGIEETNAVHVTGTEEEPPVTESFQQVEEFSDEGETDTKDEGSDVALVSSSSSSSSSSESSAEPIWPAEVIEQAISESANSMDDASSQVEMSGEVKDMVHSEDSGEVRTDTPLTRGAESEDMKPKANAPGIRRSGTIVKSKNNSKGMLRRRRRLLLLPLLLLLALTTALGLISSLNTELCNKFFHAIFASSDNRCGF